MQSLHLKKKFWKKIYLAFFFIYWMTFVNAQNFCYSYKFLDHSINQTWSYQLDLD